MDTLCKNIKQLQKKYIYIYISNTNYHIEKESNKISEILELNKKILKSNRGK